MLEFLTISALIVGPVLAVVVTRFIDAHREKRQRKWEIFRNLMCFRRQTISPAFVGTLNLIEVEFHRDEKVVDAWKDLFAHTCAERATDEERAKQWEEKFEKLKAILLQKIAENLNINLDGLEVFQSGYLPEGWSHLSMQEDAIRELTGQLLLGKRSLPMHITNWQDANANWQNADDESNKTE